MKAERSFLQGCLPYFWKNTKKGYSVFIVAGKAMDNEDLRKNHLKDKNIVYENVSYADTGLKELLSRDSINAALGKAIVKSYSDLIFLQYILENGDELTAYSRRKIVVGKSQEIKRKMGFSKSVSGKRFKNESRKEFFTRLSAL